MWRTVTRARADMPLIADLETMLPHLRASIDDVSQAQTAALEYDVAPIETARVARDDEPHG